MKEILKDKRLLMLGGASYTPFVKEYADKMGIHLFAAGNQVNKAMSQYVQAFYIAEATDVTAICELVQEKKIDGILALGNEDIIDCVIKVASICKIPFYLSEEHWNTLQNKDCFKTLCRKFGIDVVEEYTVTGSATVQELESLPYPCVFKPVDSCGSKGITVCYNVEDVCQAIEKAKRFSRSQKFMVERYMQCPEFIVSYIFVNGDIRVWMLGDRHMNTQQKGLGSLSNLSVYPSKYARLYMETVHPRMEKMLKQYGPKNGTMFIQGFVDGDKIRFFDPGMRFCGTLDTIIYSEVCGIQPLHWMVNHALTNCMCDDDEFAKMDYNLHGKVCAQLSILVHPGRVTRIQGLEHVRNLPGVIGVTQLLDEGDTVYMKGTLQQVLARIHMVKESREQICATVEEIYRLVEVSNENGNDMKMPFIIDYEV